MKPSARLTLPAEMRLELAAKVARKEQSGCITHASKNAEEQYHQLPLAKPAKTRYALLDTMANTVYHDKHRNYRSMLHN